MSEKNLRKRHEKANEWWHNLTIGQKESIYEDCHKTNLEAYEMDWNEEGDIIIGPKCGYEEDEEEEKNIPKDIPIIIMEGC